MAEAEIRPYRPSDLGALYRIALLTGDSGADASAMYRDPDLVGHIYAAPYGLLSPETAFVVEDGDGVCGYIVGALDTRAFEARLEADWWPALRGRLPEPSGPPEAWTPDQRLIHLIHHPARVPRRLNEPYPSHLHINLLPRLQGQGMGKRLMDRWLATVRKMGSRGAHLGVSGANARAIRFYQAYGLTELERLPPPYDGIWYVTTFTGG